MNYILKPATKPSLIAILCDLHVPEHHEACLRSFERWARAAKPEEIIVAGDFLEMESASEHPGSTPRTLEQDLRAGVEAVKRLQALCPRITLRAGNHETRAARTVQHRVPALASHFREPLDVFAARWGVNVEGHTHAPTRRGKLLVLHGDEGFRSSQGGGKHHATKILDIYGEPGSVVVYGHYHRGQHFVKPMAAGNAEAYAIPCMRTLQPGWVGAEVPGWSLGWGAVRLEHGRRPTVDVIRWESGKAWWGNHSY